MQTGWQESNLVLETTTGPASTSTLELASLGTHIRLGVRSNSASSTKVLDSLTALGSTQQQRSLAGRCSHSQLVKGDNLTTSFEDAGAGGLGDTESADLEGRHFQKTHVVGDSADNNDGGIRVLVLLALRNDPGKRERGAVDARSL